MAQPENDWSRVVSPAAGPAAAIGETSNGCLAGAAALPADGRGFAVVRVSRRRFFGHPALIAFLESLGRRSAAAGLPVFYVGDLAQPRGGPLPFGHASHQTGLDADIWFTGATRANPTQAERENPDIPSMLSADRHAIDPTRFGTAQVTLLKLAAMAPETDRIFVNPVIKLALCRGYGGEASQGRDWLHRLRPWWGHDDHFHVRLGCPAEFAGVQASNPHPRWERMRCSPRRLGPAPEATGTPCSTASSGTARRVCAPACRAVTARQMRS